MTGDELQIMGNWMLTASAGTGVRNHGRIRHGIKEISKYT
jgi:hypothetical protein